MANDSRYESCTGNKSFARHANVTEDLLLSLVDYKDPFDVTSLTICVDSTESPAALIGETFPNLKRLVLTDSILTSLRDLGTSLLHLEELNVSRCKLTDLDGINALAALTKLVAKDNSIADLSMLAMHDTLQHIELDGNNLDEETVLVQLSMCSQLKFVSICGNPIACREDIATLVKSHLPLLKTAKYSMLSAQSSAASHALEAFPTHPPLYDGPQRGPLLSGPAHRLQKAQSASSCGSSFAKTAGDGDADSDNTSVSTWDRPDTAQPAFLEIPRTPSKRGSSEQGSGLTFGNDGMVFAGSAALSMRKRRMSGALASPIRHSAEAFEMTSWVRDATDDALIPTARPRPSTATPAMTGSPSFRRPLSAALSPRLCSGEAPPMLSVTSFPEESFMISEDVAPDSPSSGDGKSLSILAVLDEARRDDESRKRDVSAGVEQWRESRRRLSVAGNGASELVLSARQPSDDANAARPPDAGEGCEMDDATLIQMLKAKPKNVPQLHSRDSFRKFFSGLSEARMYRLLTAAYSDLPTSEQADKVQKRLSLLTGVLK